MKLYNIAIVGGGSSAHSLIPFLSSSGHKLNLLTSKPEKWSHNVKTKWIISDGSTKKELFGKLGIITSDPEEVIAVSDIIILCMPVSQYRKALHNLAPFIAKDKKLVIGTVYGQGGFNWMVDEIEKEYNLNNIVTFACGLIPWICRIGEYGSTGITYGAKEVNYVAVRPKNEFQELNETLLDGMCYNWFKKGHFVQSENFISLTLSVDNQIIHPSRLYGLYLNSPDGWQKKGDVPYFYKDYDKLSSDLLEDLDNDYSKIRNRLKVLYPDVKFDYMLDYLSLEKFSYGSSNNNILESFYNSETLCHIETPTVKFDNVWQINRNHRFFADDIYYGLCIAKWFAEQLNIETKTIDKIIYWAQKVLDDNILDDQMNLYEKKRTSTKFKFGTPDVYGYKLLEGLME